MATVRDLVNAGFDEGLVKQAVDAAGFERKRGRGGLNLDVKGVAKVVKAYNTLLAKLTTKVAKINIDKLPYDGEEPAIKAKTEKKVTPKPKMKAESDDEEDDEFVEADDMDDEEVEEADGGDDDE